GCHGAQVQSSGLRLDNVGDALKGGNSGPVIRPGDSVQSRLIRLVAGLEGKIVMPPAGPRLTSEQVAVLRAWIDSGAKWPRAAAFVPVPNQPPKPRYWAFEPLKTPAPPQTRNRTWARNAIDRFILARLERESIEPSPEAPKTTLLRRLYLDLIGLPPEPED